MGMGTVYPRGHKLWLAFYDAKGVRQWQPSGYRVGEEAAALEVLKAIEERVAAERVLNTITPPAPRAEAMTVARYGEQWLTKVEASNLSSRKSARPYLQYAVDKLGVLELANVQRTDIRDFMRALESTPKKKGQGLLANRTQRHVYRTLREMFEEAVDDKHITANPCSLRRGQIPRVKDKNPKWRRTAIFVGAELEVLISDPRLAMVRLVGYALQGLGGLRPGEASSTRWNYWDPTTPILGRVDVLTAYDSNNHRDKDVKTDNPRAVPVHPLLAEILTEWKVHGWAEYVGRAPTEDDLIIPHWDERDRRWWFRDKNAWNRAIKEDLGMLGWRMRRQHDLRRTFTTLARASGADKEMLKWVTHGPPKGDIMDSYTSPPWETLCDQVLRVKVSRRSPAELATMPAAQGVTAVTVLHSAPPEASSGDKGPGCSQPIVTRPRPFLRRSTPPGTQPPEGSQLASNPSSPTYLTPAAVEEIRFAVTPGVTAYAGKLADALVEVLGVDAAVAALQRAAAKRAAS